VTLQTQVYIKPGELMVRADEPVPQSSTKLEAKPFLAQSHPMIMGKRYKLKLHAARAAYLTAVHTVIDASDLTTVANRRQIERHDVAHVTLETLKPVACDPALDIPQTGRFVIIDDYEIAGGGVILTAEQPPTLWCSNTFASAIRPGCAAESVPRSGPTSWSATGPVVICARMGRNGVARSPDENICTPPGAWSITSA